MQLGLDPNSRMHAVEDLLGCIYPPFFLNVNSSGNTHGCLLKGLFLITDSSGYFSLLHAVKSFGKSDLYLVIKNLQHVCLKECIAVESLYFNKKREKNIYTAN